MVFQIKQPHSALWGSAEHSTLSSAMNMFHSRYLATLRIMLAMCSARWYQKQVPLILNDNGDAGFNIDIGASNGECGALLGAVCLSC